MKCIEDYIYLPFSVGWFMILVLTTSAGVPRVAATNPEQALKFIAQNNIIMVLEKTVEVKPFKLCLTCICVMGWWKKQEILYVAHAISCCDNFFLQFL